MLSPSHSQHSQPSRCPMFSGLFLWLQSCIMQKLALRCSVQCKSLHSVSRKKWPYPSQPPTGLLKSQRINVVAQSNFFELVVFGRVDDLADHPMINIAAETSGHTIEVPTRGIFCHHVTISKRVVPYAKGWWHHNWMPIMVGSEYRE